MKWQVQEAKQRFSELIRRTLDEGPQVVTRHGEEVVVVVSVEEYRRTRPDDRPDFKEFLMSAPDFELLDLERPRRPPREFDLGE
jgi:prevent-host-death family protein